MAESMEKGGRRGFDRDVEGSLRAKLQKQQEDFVTAHPDTHRLLSGLIDSIDFDSLRHLYLEHARKSGVAETDVNFVGPDQIYLVPPGTWIESSSSMKQLTYANAIVINAPFWESVKDDEEFPTQFFESIIHEYVHTTGAMKSEGWYTQSGYHASSDRIDMYGLFNEGVTQMIEDFVATEYLKQSPLSLPDGRVLTVDMFQKHRENYIRGGGYAEARSFVYGLCEHIGMNVGIPAEVVQKAFIKGYYDGSGFSSKEGREFLKTLVGENFYFSLRDAKSAEDIHGMIEEFKLPPIDDETSAKLQVILGPAE